MSTTYKGHTRVGRKKKKTKGLVSILQNDERGEAQGVK
jgi:hypothetical protein